MTLSIALDLGTTRIKGGVLDDDGALETVFHEPSPEVRGDALERECDPEAYLDVATAMLGRLGAYVPKGTPLGITSQRSSFTLWDKESGSCVIPLISWQDRRAQPWCEAHAPDYEDVTETTGLLLSPHYVGPKLAYLMEQDSAVREGIEEGRLMLGTLETYLLWHWTGRKVHQTDVTMAARTLLYDVRDGAWSRDLVSRYGIERLLLPQVVSTCGQSVDLDIGVRVSASVADQSSGVLAVLGLDEACALVNLGTGGFVMKPTGESIQLKKGYLSGPLLGQPNGRTQFTVEGTINGAGASVDVFGRGPTSLPDSDPAPGAFCIPDNAGIGAPHWRADMNMQFSKAVEQRGDDEKRRLVMEGVLFRVREILEDITDSHQLSRVVLTGGLARDPFIAHGLASCLGRAVDVCEEPEATVLGVARLAAGVVSPVASEHRVMEADDSSYLRSKYDAWRCWVEDLLRDV